ncbi:acyltransferase domain-containing protein [Actinorugispora endophytica]|nr:acyltransferase domain-containing protein [Actinorugispora endophytica]
MDRSLTASALGLDPAAASSLSTVVGFAEPPPAPLGPASEAGPVLDLLGLDGADRADLLALWPDEGWPRAARWLLDACYARVVADVGRPGWVDWPDLVSAADARVRCAPVYAFVAATPALVERHARLGVGRDVTEATLADVGRHVAKNRDMFGHVGLELPVWIALHYRGSLFEAGRLQYEPSRLGPGGAVTWYGADAGQGLPEELREGRPSARLHIPETGPLDPVAVEESLKRGRAVLAAATGGDVPVATCTSWLLDPQLKRYLDPGSNIIAFQDRFTLLDEGAPGDEDVFRFVFRRTRVVPDEVRATTRLERGVLDLLGRGGHWRARTGWLRLP